MRLRVAGGDGRLSGVPIVVRAVVPGDLDALVRLRLANAEWHVRLGPGVHRLPDAAAVRKHFEDVLAAQPDVVILVAEVAGEVAGMAELVLLPEPPDHQILIKRRAADIHTVVLAGQRGQGAGTALVTAAEQAAAERGVTVLRAVIFTPNQDAVRFYGAAGFGPYGTMLIKELDGPAPE